MKNNKGITLVALVVTIIVLIILAGISINLILGDNGIITIAKRAMENIELAKIPEETELNELYEQIETEGSNSGNLPYDSIAKLTEFKTAIANAIDEAGGIKPEVSAETAVFANNIKGIVKEVTKNATATSQDIAEGKTAWVNGEIVTGTFKENTIKFKTLENPVGTTIKEYNKANLKENNITKNLSDRLNYNSSDEPDYMCYAYPVDFTNVSNMTLYQWNYISMHFTIALALTDNPLYSRQDVINNAIETWTYSTSGTSSASNYITKDIDVSEINGTKYISIAVVSKNTSSDTYYSLTNNIISFN